LLLYQQPEEVNVIQNDKAVSILNNLIETCKDGEQGFRSAAESLKSPAIKAKFVEYAAERGQMGRELQAEVRRLGGDPEKSGSTAGAVHRGWLGLKAVLTGHDDHAIVAEAERGEDAAKAAFDAALTESLPPSTQALVQQHAAKVRRAHDDVRAVRDQHVVLK
jgi:uncharacterized protein (TIGR02284 family)